MQFALERYLLDRGIRHVERGAVVEMPPYGSPYRAVLHAVAVDGFYASSSEVVSEVIAASLGRAAALSAQKVALAGLAMGYGRLPVAAFAAGLGRVIGRAFPPVAEVVLCLRSGDDVSELRTLLPVFGAAEPTLSGDSSG
jgi:O-acetyl-ADP-ribose deacetylase